MFRRRRAPIRCFYQDFRREDLSPPMDLGLRPVDVYKIVGSVGRCMDFSEDFEPRKGFGLAQSRLESVKKAMKEERPLPLIELYKVKDEYFVLDGHHRVVAARELGKRFLDAHVVEFLPLGGRPEDALYRERASFEVKTKLEGVRLSEKESYLILMKDIERYQKTLQAEQKIVYFEDAAGRWYFEVYQPAVKEIQGSSILRFFNGLSAGDIYACLLRHQDLRHRKQDLERPDQMLKTMDLKNLTVELYSLLEKDRHFTSNETIRRFQDILPPCLYIKFCPHWPTEEKFNLASIPRLRIFSIRRFFKSISSKLSTVPRNTSYVFHFCCL